MPTKITKSEMPEVKRKLLSKQKGACIFCGGDLTKVASINQVIDHNHATGIIRGVAHRGCNGVEGKVLRFLMTWGKCKNKAEVIRMMKRLIAFWSNEPTTPWIYPSHKNPAEKRLAKNKKARRLYAKKKKEL